MQAPLHIGQKIKEVWKRSGLTGAEFARLIHRQRQSIYHLFEQASIDTGLLEKIGLVLKHDFFEDYRFRRRSDPSLKPLASNPSEAIDQLSASIRQLSSEISRLARAITMVQAKRSQ